MIWKYVDLKVENLKKQLEAKIEEISIRYKLPEKNIEFEGESDGIYMQNAGVEYENISDDHATISDFKRELDKIDKLYYGIRQIDNQFFLNFH